MQELWVQEFDQVRKPKPSEKHVLFSRKKKIPRRFPPNSIRFIKKKMHTIQYGLKVRSAIIPIFYQYSFLPDSKGSLISECNKVNLFQLATVYSSQRNIHLPAINKQSLFVRVVLSRLIPQFHFFCLYNLASSLSQFVQRAMEVVINLKQPYYAIYATLIPSNINSSQVALIFLYF